MGGGAALAAAAAPSWLPRVALARDFRGSQRDVLVLVYMRGAADALTMIPPYLEPEYYAKRPTLAVPQPGSPSPDAAIDLDGFFGLAPSLSPLLAPYADGRLLLVHACGMHDDTRSHFEAQAFTEVGIPGEGSLASGWLGRHLSSVAPASAGALLRGVAINDFFPLMLYGGTSSLAINNLDTYGLSGPSSSLAARRQALSDLYGTAGPPLAPIAGATLGTIDLLNTINFAGYTPAGGASYPNNSFGRALKSSAALIKAQVGVEAIAVDIHGWDTHSDQGNNAAGYMAGLMNSFAQGLAAFYRDMTALTAPSFTLVAMSEFGRELEENGTFGTDHGHGAAMFVMGSCVNGGRVLTQWPGLAPEQLFQDRDLDVTIDFRDVLAEVIQQRLGNPKVSTVFPGFTPTPQGVFAC
jgi:uncharacterized protein (DUF1501 family)